VGVGCKNLIGRVTNATDAAVASASPSVGGRLCLCPPCTSSPAACWSSLCSSRAVSGRRNWRFSYSGYFLLSHLIQKSASLRHPKAAANKSVTELEKCRAGGRPGAFEPRLPVTVTGSWWKKQWARATRGPINSTGSPRFRRPHRPRDWDGAATGGVSRRDSEVRRASAPLVLAAAEKLWTDVSL
jgi:hypothetical protein